MARRVMSVVRSGVVQRCTAGMPTARTFAVCSTPQVGCAQVDAKTQTLSPDLVLEAAQRLSEAKAENKLMQLDGVPAWSPVTLADVYAIQDAIIELPHNQGKLVGWKIGATAKASQARLGLPSPFAGPVFADDVVTLPEVGGDFDGDAPVPELPEGVEPVHTVDTQFGTVRGVEGEFAIIIEQDIIPFDDMPFLPPDLKSAAQTVIPCIEVVGTRSGGDLTANVPLLLSDQGGLGQILLAPERYHHDAPGVEWPAISARMFVSNQVVGAGDAEDALGHPLIATTWLANHLTTRGRFLRKGDLVSTGTVTGMSPVAAGDIVYASFDAYAKFGLVGPVRVV